MTPALLFEYAQLDALGLLDEQERAVFEAELSAAPQALQTQVEAERARFADFRAYLPDVAPAPELRSKVIQAVLHAAGTPASTQASTEAFAQASAAAPIRHTAGRESSLDVARHVRPLKFNARVSALWRGAAIGFAAAALTFGFCTLYMWGEHERLDTEVSNGALVQRIIEHFGPDYVEKALFDVDTRRVVFQPQSEDMSGRAAIWSNPEWDESRLFCIALPGPDDGGTYRVVTLDDNDNIIATIAEFRSTGALMSSGVSMDMTGASRLAIIRAGDASSQSEFLLIADADTQADAARS